MITARLYADDNHKMWMDADPSLRLRGNFPLHGGTGTENTAVVYFELEPGCALGTHTDSAEEILLIVEGTVEVTVGDETGRIGQGELAVVPEMVPHGVRNVGDTPARVVGFFPSARMVATFEHPFMPMDQRVIAAG